MEGLLSRSRKFATIFIGAVLAASLFVGLQSDFSTPVHAAYTLDLSPCVKMENWELYTCYVKQLPESITKLPNGQYKQDWDLNAFKLELEECGGTDIDKKICETRNTAKHKVYDRMNTFISVFGCTPSKLGCTEEGLSESASAGRLGSPAFYYAEYTDYQNKELQKLKQSGNLGTKDDKLVKQEQRQVQIERAKADEANPSSSKSGALGTLWNFVASILNWLVGIISTILISLINLELKLVAGALGTANAVNTVWIIGIWKAIRDFMNIMFIMVLLVIAIANIVRFEADKYAIKTALPKFIFAVLFVNFSKLICGIVLDFANILEAGVWSIAGIGPNGTGTPGVPCPGFSLGVDDGSLACHLGQTFSATLSPGLIFAGKVDGQGWMLLANVILFILLIGVTVALLGIICLFIVRTLVLWVLICTSPFMFAGTVLPATEQYASKWKDNFFKYAFMHVTFAFPMVIAVRAIEGFVKQTYGNDKTNIMAQMDPSASWELFGLDMTRFLQIIFMVAMIYVAVYESVKSEHAPAFIGKISELGKNAMKWTAGRAAYFPLPGIVKKKYEYTDKKTGEKKTGFKLGFGASSAMGYKKAAHTLYGAFQASAESKHEDLGDVAALGGAKVFKGTVGRLPFLKGWGEEIEQLSEVKGMQNTRKRAGELKEFYKQASKHDVMEMILTTDRVDRMLLGLEVMGEAGQLEKKDLITIALKKGWIDFDHDGKKEKLTDLSEHGIQERLHELTPKELEEHRVESMDAINKFVGLKRLTQDTQQQSESARQSRVSNWTRWAAQNKDRSTDLMFELIEQAEKNPEKKAEISEQLEAVIAYNLRDGKSDPDSVMAALFRALDTGVLSEERVGAIESEHLYRMPSIEYFLQTLYKGKGALSANKNPAKQIHDVAEIIKTHGADSSQFRGIMQTIYDDDSIKTRVDKMMSKLDPNLTDHDYFPYLMRYFNKENAGFLTETVEGKQRITDTGLANLYFMMPKLMTSNDDHGLVEALKGMERMDKELFEDNWNIQDRGGNILDQTGTVIQIDDGVGGKQNVTREMINENHELKMKLVNDNRFSIRAGKIARTSASLDKGSVYGGTLGQGRAILMEAIQSMNAGGSASDIRKALLRHQMMNFRGGYDPSLKGMPGLNEDQEKLATNEAGSRIIPGHPELDGREGYSGGYPDSAAGEKAAGQYRSLKLDPALKKLSEDLGGGNLDAIRQTILDALNQRGAEISVSELKRELSEQLKGAQARNEAIPPMLKLLFDKYSLNAP